MSHECFIVVIVAIIVILTMHAKQCWRRDQDHKGREILNVGCSSVQRSLGTGNKGALADNETEEPTAGGKSPFRGSTFLRRPHVQPPADWAVPKDSSFTSGAPTASRKAAMGVYTPNAQGRRTGGGGSTPLKFLMACFLWTALAHTPTTPTTQGGKKVPGKTLRKST